MAKWNTRPLARIEAYYNRRLTRLARERAEVYRKALDLSTITITAINKIVAELNKITARLKAVESERISNTVTKSTSKENKSRLTRFLKAAIGISFARKMEQPNVARALRRHKFANTKRITNISEEVRKKVEDTLTRWMTGQPEGSLQTDLTKIFNGDKNKAKLVARDQVSKINGNLNQIRQTNIGIESYIWRTADDEKVRPTHDENDNLTFRWDSPPSTGHPGEEVQCRCTAEPDLTELEKELS